MLLSNWSINPFFHTHLVLYIVETHCLFSASRVAAFHTYVRAVACCLSIAFRSKQLGRSQF
jgi:hypothetical protein